MSTGVEELISKSARLAGQIVHERPIWNSVASTDAIRHYCYGTSDGNPLWLDPSYGRNSRHGRNLAPPGFICSVLYPFLHGAPTEAPLFSLIGSISVEWHSRIFEGDSITAEARQGAVTASFDRAGRGIAIVPAETIYRNQQDAIVAKANGTMVRIEPRGNDRFLDRTPSSYTPAQIAAMDRALRCEHRSGEYSPAPRASMPGTSLPIMMCGPLSIGDLICWQAGIGPSYRAGSLGYFDALKSPHTTVLNPVTGWPLKYSQQHEDFMMAAQRGMPAPFDNSLMRFAWIIPMLTDWIGDAGFLRQLTIETGLPLIYGDTTWYRAVIWAEKHDRSRELRQLELRITGVNQLGQTTTTGSAILELPLDEVYVTRRSVPLRNQASENLPARVFSRILAQATSRPSATAIVFQDKQISFEDLLRTSNSIAHHLRTNAEKRNIKLVALVFERSVDAIASILAVMRLEAAFLCIDPNDPADRVREILNTARPDIILADRENAERMRTNAVDVPAPLAVWNERVSPALANSPTSVEVIHRDEANELAYVMTTSGSLGRPKCVAVSSPSFHKYIDTLGQTFGYVVEDRLLHTASLSFSASIRQTFGALCNGSTIVLASEAERRDPALLFELMRRQAVTVWDTVPTAWQAAIDFLETFSQEEKARLMSNSLRSILLTGEPLKWRTPRMWREAGGRGRVFNLYSQTETAGTVAAYELPDKLGSDNDVVPVGRPLSDCEILFESDEVTGEQEICVSSPRLAAGYLGDPESTMDEFPNRPFHECGYRKTGDTGYLTHDGLLSINGRLGLVTKIRGQQVSLVAVERVIGARPGIIDAAVACHEWQNSKQLVGYIVSRQDGPKLEEDVRQSVLEALGPAAVPTELVFLDRLPVTKSNKLDRSKLPPPAEWAPSEKVSADGLSEADVLASISEIVSEIFCRTLSRTAVGPERNFFALGGNSLMATRIVAQIRKAFAIEFSMKSFFDNPTIDGVSMAVEVLLLQELE
jgi:amino acid adenylation domain-containing protein